MTTLLKETVVYFFDRKKIGNGPTTSVRNETLNEVWLEVKRLREERDAIRKALEYYADKSNWEYTWHDSPSGDEDGECADRIDFQDLTWDYKGREETYENLVDVYAGKRAREVLAKLEDE